MPILEIVGMVANFLYFKGYYISFVLYGDFSFGRLFYRFCGILAGSVDGLLRVGGGFIRGHASLELDFFYCRPFLFITTTLLAFGD